MAFLGQVQAVLQQIGAIAATTVATGSAAFNKLNLYSHIDPLLTRAGVVVGPIYKDATKQILPLLSPYLDLAEPYLKGAKPHLEKISQKETCLILGGIFGGVFLLQLLFALTATCRRGSSKLKAFSPTVFWLLMCFVIHSWIEYSFVFHRKASPILNGMNLYGAADYRYGYGKNLDLEAGTAAMEAITAFITGPLCLLLAWGIVGNKPWRWAVQIITCSCQLYGLSWFMAHPFFSADKISSDDPFLYWVIFVGFNAPWGIVPPFMLLSAVFHVNRVMARAQAAPAPIAAGKSAQVQDKKKN